jgi:hypothetical protein
MTVTQEHEQLGRRQPLSIPGKYLSLTTYRRDGTPVSTPVWFVEEEGRLFVTTAAATESGGDAPRGASRRARRYRCRSSSCPRMRTPGSTS